LVFGLGKVHQLDTLRVDWISGTSDTFTKLPLNSEIRIVEGQQTYCLVPKNNESTD
jgi:hypothetical protein